MKARITKTAWGIYLLLSLSLAACNSSGRYLSRMESVVETVEAEDVTAEEIDKATKKYEELMQEYDSHKDEMTQEDFKRFGRLQIRFIKATAKAKVKDIGRGLNDIIEQAGLDK